jgi:hypothetical protein
MSTTTHFLSHKKSADKKKSVVARDLAHGNGRDTHLLLEGFGTAQLHRFLQSFQENLGLNFTSILGMCAWS